MSKRVVITGAGAVSPLGHDLATIAANLGRSPAETGHGAICGLNEHTELWTIRGLDDTRTLSGRLKRKLDMFSVYGMVAARMALASSRVDADSVGPHAVGIYVGNCLGGWGYTQPELEALHARGVGSMGPYVATAWFPAALQGQLSLAHNFKGHSKTFSARDVAGLQAIGHGADAIRSGRASLVLCGASEDLSSPYLRAVLQRYVHANRSAPATFGALRQTAFSDGAAFLMLEDHEHAKRRGATVLAEVTGFADRFCGSADGAARVVAGALQAAGGQRRGARLLVLDGLQTAEPALASTAARAAGVDAVAVDPRAALANQFAVSGVTEAVLAAYALSQGRLRPASLGVCSGAPEGRFGDALIQRLSPQGNVAVLGLGAA